MQSDDIVPSENVPFQSTLSHMAPPTTPFPPTREQTNTLDPTHLPHHRIPPTFISIIASNTRYFHMFSCERVRYEAYTHTNTNTAHTSNMGRLINKHSARARMLLYALCIVYTTFFFYAARQTRQRTHTFMCSHCRSLSLYRFLYAPVCLPAGPCGVCR